VLDLDEVRDALARHLPDRAAASVVFLGSGLENAVYEVDGDLIVRCWSEDSPRLRSAAVRREARLLEVAASRSTVPVPTPVVVDPHAGLLAYRKIVGVPLRIAEVTAHARVLAAFLNRLHGTYVTTIDQVVARDDRSLEQWRDEAHEHYGRIGEYLPASARRSVEIFLTASLPHPSDRSVFCHLGLGAEHILMDPATDAITGVIDWSEAAIADRARDFARIYCDLGPAMHDALVASYRGGFDDDTRERTVFYARCTLLEDIANGLDSGDRAYATSALRRLDRTFA
jgi:aminoglycoside phosphotransferase (APT) family kinase protein